MTDRELRMEEALTRILQWSMAYPVGVFRPVSEDDLKIAATVLKASGIDISSLHASWARHIVDGIGEIAKSALTD